jgi:hypothetical protein
MHGAYAGPVVRRVQESMAVHAGSGICELSGLMLGSHITVVAAVKALTVGNGGEVPGNSSRASCAPITALSAEGCSLTARGAVFLAEFAAGQPALTELSLADNPASPTLPPPVILVFWCCIGDLTGVGVGRSGYR